MRSLALLALLLPSLALAQKSQPARPDAGPDAGPPSHAGTFDGGDPDEALVATDDAERHELFALTPFWRLAPSTYRLELSYAASGTLSAVDQASELRATVGLTDHVQLAVAEDFGRPSDGEVAHQGSRVALRYSVAGAYGQVPGNPVVEVEFNPRHLSPDRAAIRASAGGAVTDRVVTATGVFLEQNLERHTPAGVDGSFGVTASGSYRYRDHTRFGAELALGLAERGTDTYRPVLKAGPSMSAEGGGFTVTTSLLCDLSEATLKPEPLVVLGRSF